MEAKIRFNLKFTKEYKEKLDKQAVYENRTATNLIEYIVIEYLRKNEK